MPVFDPLPEAPTAGQLPLPLWGAQQFSVVDWPQDSFQIGYNSHTWLLADGDDLAVLKAVPADQAVKFASGLTAAGIAELAGIPAGAPRPTLDGATVAVDGPWSWALLNYVRGTRTDASDAAQLAQAGRTLGRIHTALKDTPPLPETMVWTHMEWALAPMPFLDGLEWIQQALREVMEQLPDDLSQGVIHCDPRLTEFRFDGDTIGLIDWGEVMHGPHISDLAATVSFMDEGTDPKPFLSGWAETAPGSADELVYLPVLLKARAALEGWVYARRAAFGVDLGQIGEHNNHTLIERSRQNILAAEALPRDFYRI